MIDAADAPAYRMPMLKRIKELAVLARGGMSYFRHRGVTVWQFGVVCDQAALAQAIDAAMDDRRTPSGREVDVQAAASLCRVVVVPVRGEDDAPMVATWTRGTLGGDQGAVRVGATPETADAVRRGLLALIRRRLGLSVLRDTPHLSAVA